MKKISYIICLTAILCSCNNELPIENVQELQTPKSKEDSEILSFKNSEEFLSTIENFDLDGCTAARLPHAPAESCPCSAAPSLKG